MFASLLNFFYLIDINGLYHCFNVKVNKGINSNFPSRIALIGRVENTDWLGRDSDYFLFQLVHFSNAVITGCILVGHSICGLM